MNALFTLLTLLTSAFSLNSYLNEEWGYFFLGLACVIGVITIWITLGVKSKRINEID